MKHANKIIDLLKKYNCIILFVALSVSGGLFFATTVPFGHSEDETVNMFRAYSLSRGNFAPEKIGTVEAKGKTFNVYQTPVAKSIVKLEWAGVDDNSKELCYIGAPTYPDFFPNGRIFSSAGCKVSESGNQAVIDAANQPLNPSESRYVGTDSSSAYSFLAYIPGAVGFFIAQLLQTTAGEAVLLARLFTLLAYIIIVTLALYLLKSYRTKWVLAVVALFPNSLALAVNVNVDSALLPISFLFFALVIRSFKDPHNFSTWMKITMLACAILLPILKAPYGLMSLAILFTPIYPDGRKGLLWRFAALLVISVPALLYNLTVRDAANATRYLINPTRQQSDTLNIINALHDPIGFSKIYLQSFLVSDWVAGVGILTHQRVRMPASLITFNYLLLVLAAAAAAKDFAMLKKKLRRSFLIAAALAGVVALLSLPALLHLQGSTITDIIGVQGRYFIPYLPFVAIFFAVIFNMRLTAGKYSNLIFSLCLIAALFIACLWYYLQISLWAQPV